MCFYHVVAKVNERTWNLPEHLTKIVVTDVYDLHFSCSEGEYEERKKQVLTRWRLTSGLEEFTRYFEGQWLTGKFATWQCHRSPVGFAKTNNPVEQLNRVIEQRYTQHRRLRMAFLLQRLLECCKSESASMKAFKNEVGGNSRFKTRATDMRRNGLLVEAPLSCARIAFLIDDDCTGVTQVWHTHLG
ncbi:unnamed protein product [Phytophthora fragariaefolia]|uniref:Unnamed protein product n=1 Tax=Phytophthora fragariaefolia TaxID=1490495 RepID=A0A9W6Y608_9STRA|nr:unnamed protein product [Phytophthora fragariaefolia]